MTGKWLVCIGYYTKNRKTGLLNPKLKIKKVVCETKSDCEVTAVGFLDHLFRKKAWIDISYFEKTIDEYLTTSLSP